MVQELTTPNNAISFAERVASSDVFKSLFKDGMALVEETAAYLDAQAAPMRRCCRARRRWPMPPRACA